MNEDGEHWIEVTCLGDTERHFIEVNTGATRTEPFEPVDESQVGGWRVVYGPRPVSSGFELPLAFALIALVLATCVLVR